MARLTLQVRHEAGRWGSATVHRHNSSRRTASTRHWVAQLVRAAHKDVASAGTATMPGKQRTFDYNGEELAVPGDVAPLFEPFDLGPFHLSHRLVYAPLTRSRAADSIPKPHMATYYGQRASRGGLMITEATAISLEGHGYPRVPGIYTKEQIEGWKASVTEVHKKGAIFFLQLWHVGRASHADFQPNGGPPVAPSAIGIGSKWPVFTEKGGPYAYPTPQALDESEIPNIVEQFAQGARNALEAGFDGVELHGANGYLLDQFMKSSSNTRKDKYGGSIENRCRLVLEAVGAVVAAVGASKVGIRLSPFNVFLDAIEPEPVPLFTYLVKELNKLGLAYVHFVEPRVLGNADQPEKQISVMNPILEACSCPIIVAGGYDREKGAHAIVSERGNLVAYGRLYLANPDLPKRFLLNAPLNEPDTKTFYSPGMDGYLDYPILEENE